MITWLTWISDVFQSAITYNVYVKEALESAVIKPGGLLSIGSKWLYFTCYLHKYPSVARTYHDFIHVLIEQLTNPQYTSKSTHQGPRHNDSHDFNQRSIGQQNWHSGPTPRTLQILWAPGVTSPYWMISPYQKLEDRYTRQPCFFFISISLDIAIKVVTTTQKISSSAASSLSWATSFQSFLLADSTVIM